MNSKCSALFQYPLHLVIKKHDQQSKDGAVVKKVSKARVKKTKEQKKIISLNDSSIGVF